MVETTKAGGKVSHEEGVKTHHIKQRVLRGLPRSETELSFERQVNEGLPKNEPRIRSRHIRKVLQGSWT